MSNLSITQESHKRVEVFTIAGRIDSSNASELDGALKEAMKQGRYNFVLELSQVEYMSSAGLRAIVAALRESKKNRGDVRLATPSERVAEVLTLAGLDSLYEIFDDLTAAVGSF